MYKRVLLKLSGEALLGKEKFGIARETCQTIAKDIIDVQKKGVEVAIVIGGGNIVRGKQNEEHGIERVPLDQMGMLATVINGIGLKQVFEKEGCRVKVLSAFTCQNFVELYSPQKAQEYLKEGYAVIFVGGTGMPFFTTDTAAAVRAIEISADILLKATKVDGVYDKDPHKFSDAKRFEKITYQQILKDSLKVMDLTATALCMDNDLPILVFDIFEPSSLKQAILKEKIGTFVGV